MCTTDPIIVVSFKLVVPLTVKFCSITTSLPLILTSPVPAASMLRSVFGVNTVILLLLISIVLFVKLVASIVVPTKVFACIELANKSLLILKLSFGINISPVPTARSSKSALLDVVVIKLSSISISSNSALPETVKSPPTSTSPCTVWSPVCTMLPVIVRSP